MVANIFIIISVFFFVGGIGVWRIGIKKPEERSRIILKYFTYAVIVYGLCSVFAFTQFSFLALTSIAVAGSFEIVYAWLCSEKRKQFVLISGILIYLLIAFLFLSGAQKFPGDKLLPIYGLILCFDGFSQICGQLFGRRKITEKISPNKTLAGLIGGAVLSYIGGYFIFGGNDSIFFYSIAWALLIFGAFTGDLLASFYKRKCGVKDYSNLLPGHGGILDRFDSFIFSIALVEAVGLFTRNFIS